LIACALAFAAILAGPIPAHAAEKPISFINDVAPILKEHCFACHDAKKRSGKLDMTSYEKFMHGGSNDSPVSAGSPDDSLLLELVSAKGSKRMPPEGKGQALARQSITVFERWIKEGAKLDAGVDPKADLIRELRIRWKPPTPPTAYPFPTIVNAVAFTPDGKQVVASGQNELTVWSLADGKLVKRLRTRSERAYGIVFSPDGKLIVAGGRPGQEGDVRVYDLSLAGKVENGVAVLDGVGDSRVMLKQLLDCDDSVLALTISPDGKRIAAGGCDRTVRVWNIGGGAANAVLEQSIENHADWVLGVAFSADGKHLFSASRDKTAKVWDLTSKESVMTFPDHQAPVYGVAVSIDGKAGYSVGEDKQLRIWSAVAEGKQLRAMGGHQDAVLKIVAHPKQPLVFTASADKTVRVWNPENGSQVRALSGLTDQVFAIALSPDGTQVAAGSYAGELAVWNVNDGKLVRIFNASPGFVARK
jgi:WD40 repeat protein